MPDACAIVDRWISLGKQYDAAMAEASIQRCDCMVRYKDGGQLPAFRRGKQFTDPEGDAIVTPDSFEDMHWSKIAELLRQRNEIYIGHIFR